VPLRRDACKKTASVHVGYIGVSAASLERKLCPQVRIVPAGDSRAETIAGLSSDPKERPNGPLEMKSEALQTQPTDRCAPMASSQSGISRACPACGRTTEHSVRFRTNGCEILQCKSCGLGRTETAGFDPAAYYTEDYFSGRHADGYSDYLGAEPVLRREFARAVDFIRRYRRNGKLLELGCAYGFFLKEAARYFDVSGIELAAEAADHARRAGLTVVQGAADEANLRQLGHADVIVLFDVIEHLPEPRATLALCHRHLNPGGIIVITTGDFGSMVARLAGVKWRLMTPPQHLWFFTQESMRHLSASLGFSVEHVDHPWKIVPASLIVFQLRRMLGVRGAGVATASGIGIPVNLFDAMRIVLRKAPR
jgi:SAM-dependent methyltransferase